MEGKKKAGLLAILCLSGASFAWGGFGMDLGFGNLFGMGNGMHGAPEGSGGIQNVSVETRAEFMQATHEGDYETAMELHEEYGLGGKRMEFATPEILQLTADIFNAQTLGNWVEAVVLQDKLAEIVSETAQSAMEERKAACDAALEENAGEIADLREQIKTAREAGDEETLKTLHEQMKELVPDGCGMGMGKMEGMPPGMEGQPPEMKGECKAALEENKDEVEALREQIKAAKEAGDEETLNALHEQMEELMPEGCAKPPEGRGMRGMPGEGRTVTETPNAE